MKLVRAGDPPPAAPENHFTGKADPHHRLDEQRLAGMRVVLVAFSDGGRTLWHRHHGEQVLYVLSGDGWIQKEDEDRLPIQRGDLVYVAPGEKHWHGAQAGKSLEHLAVTRGETEWGPEVRDPR
jgi:4-carboxymuconolactone decarboxylase